MTTDEYAYPLQWVMLRWGGLPEAVSVVVMRRIPARPAAIPSPAVLLLGTGVVLMLSAATVFVAREWDRLGAPGQALVLAAATILAGAAAALSWRQRLTATTEALTAVTAGLLVLDLLGARSRGLLGLDSVSVAGYVAAASACVAVLGAVVARTSTARGFRVTTGLAVACLAVPVAGAALVIEVAQWSNELLGAETTAAERAATGWVEGLLLVGLAARPAWLIRDAAGLGPLVVVTRWLGWSALTGAGLLAVGTAVGGLALAGAYSIPAATAIPETLVLRVMAVGSVGVLLGGWRCAVPRPRAQSVAAAAGWSVVALAALAALVALGAPLEAVVAGPMLGLATATRLLPADAGLGRLRVAAAGVAIAGAGLAAAVLLGAGTVRLAVLMAAAAESGGRADPGMPADLWHARLLLVLLVTVVIGTAVGTAVGTAAGAGRIAPSSAWLAAWHSVAALAGVAAPCVVWSVLTPPAEIMAMSSAGVAGLVAFTSGLGRRLRGSWWGPVATATTVGAWWLTGLALAVASGSIGGFVMVTGLGVLAVAAVVTTPWPAVRASVGDEPGAAAVRSDLAAAAGLSAAAMGGGLFVGQWIGGAAVVLAISVLAALVLLVVPAWPSTRAAAALLGVVAVLVLVSHAAGRAPLGWEVGTAAALSAHAIAGTRAVAGKYPIRPHAARHVAIPVTVATLAVELVDLLVLRLRSVPLDAEFLPVAAVLAVGASYSWLQLRERRRSAGRPPLSGVSRVVLRDLVLPAMLAALAAAVMVAIGPLLAPLPLTTGLLPLLVVLLAVLVNARTVLRRGEGAQPVPLRWVRDVGLRLSETVALVVALAVLRPVTGLTVEAELATVAIVTLGAHAVRTARDRRSAVLRPSVQLTDVVTLLSAITLGVTSPLLGTSPLWVSGLTWLCNGLWALFIAVAVAGQLAGPWPGHAAGRGWLAIRSGAAMAFIGYVLLLTAVGSPPIELFSVPLGVLLTLFGWWAMTGRPGGDAAPSEPLLGSLRCLLPGLLIAVGPSAWLAMTLPEDGLRPVLTAAVAAGLAMAGLVLRWRAPLLVGAGVAIGVSVVQALPIVSGLPQWVWLAAAGLLALAVGATYEAQVRRLRTAGGQWRALR